MKTRVTLSVLFLFLVFATTVILSACDFGDGVFLPSSGAEDIASEVVRIHIRANSDSAEDQAVKLAVRDDVTARLTKMHGFDYKARVELKTETFPEREYDGYVFPAGEYDALMIYLGEGKGDNWWCVAFPPLCFVPADGGEDITYVSWVKEFLEDIFS